MASDARQLKIEAARAALEHVRNGMILGLGTGSTAVEFVRLLGEKIARGDLRDITGICTSKATEDLAESVNIPLIPIEQLVKTDLAIDGADEIDPQLRLIKGRGGALLREKIVEQASDRFIVIADETKIVGRLGRGRLPVEVVSSAVNVLTHRLVYLNLDPQPRMNQGNWFMTDEGHRILDVVVPPHIEIADLVEEIWQYAGVVETGFFPNEASEAIIAGENGVRRMKR